MAPDPGGGTGWRGAMREWGLPAVAPPAAEGPGLGHLSAQGCIFAALLVSLRGLRRVV